MDSTDYDFVDSPLHWRTQRIVGDTLEARLAGGIDIDQLIQGGFLSIDADDADEDILPSDAGGDGMETVDDPRRIDPEPI